MAHLGSFPVEFGMVFPSGVYAAGGVEKVRDFDRSSADKVVQQADKATGLPLWVIEVIDADPEARQRMRQGQGGRRLSAGAAERGAGVAVHGGGVRGHAGRPLRGLGAVPGQGQVRCPAGVLPQGHRRPCPDARDYPSVR